MVTYQSAAESTASESLRKAYISSSSTESRRSLPVDTAVSPGNGASLRPSPLLETATRFSAWGATTGLETAQFTLAPLDAKDAARRLELELGHREHLVAHSAGNEMAVFLLWKIVDARRLHITTLASRIIGAEAWLAFAQLWRAELIDCLGDEVLATRAGIDLIADMEPSPDD